MSGMGLTAKEFNKALMRTTMSSLKALPAADAHGLPMDAELVAYMEEWKKAGGRTDGPTPTRSTRWCQISTTRQSASQELVRPSPRSGASLSVPWVSTSRESTKHSRMQSDSLRTSKHERQGLRHRGRRSCRRTLVNFNKSGELTRPSTHGSCSSTRRCRVRLDLPGRLVLSRRRFLRGIQV